LLLKENINLEEAKFFLVPPSTLVASFIFKQFNRDKDKTKAINFFECIE